MVSNLYGLLLWPHILYSKFTDFHIFCHLVDHDRWFRTYRCIKTDSRFFIRLSNLFLIWDRSDGHIVSIYLLYFRHRTAAMGTLAASICSIFAIVLDYVIPCSLRNMHSKTGDLKGAILNPSVFPIDYSLDNFLGKKNPCSECWCKNDSKVTYTIIYV